MEELYKNETFKTILLYASILIYAFIAFVLIAKKYYAKSKIADSVPKNTKVEAEDVRDLFAFEMPKNAKRLKPDGEGDSKENNSEYDADNNFFKDGNHDLKV